MTSIALAWLSFKVDVDKINTYLKSILSSNYDGIVCNETSINLMFLNQYSEDDSTKAVTYWNSLTSTSFNPTLTDIATAKINDAIGFGNEMIVQASVENVLLGITQAGKTKDVSDYLSNMQQYLRAGSLYAAIDEINSLMSQDIPSSISPFITLARLTSYKNKIQTYLEIPLT